LLFRGFFGRLTTPVHATPGWRMRAVLVFLALLSIVGGWLEVPETMQYLWPEVPRVLHHRTLFTDCLQTALPAARLEPTDIKTESTVQLITGAVSLFGVLLAAALFLRRP